MSGAVNLIPGRDKMPGTHTFRFRPAWPAPVPAAPCAPARRRHGGAREDPRRARTGQPRLKDECAGDMASSQASQSRPFVAGWSQRSAQSAARLQAPRKSGSTTQHHPRITLRFMPGTAYLRRCPFARAGPRPLVISTRRAGAFGSEPAELATGGRIDGLSCSVSAADRRAHRARPRSR